MPAENRRFDQAIEEFDSAHREDPRPVLVDDQEMPWLFHEAILHERLQAQGVQVHNIYIP